MATSGILAREILWTPPPEEPWGAIVHQFSSVQFSHLVVSDSLRPHGLQHTRLPCPSIVRRVAKESDMAE